MIVIVTRPRCRNQYSAEVDTILEMMGTWPTTFPKDKLKKLQTQFCDSAKRESREQSRHIGIAKAGKMRAYKLGSPPDLLNRKVSE